MNELSTENNDNIPNPVSIYTDGACSPNPGAGGYGVILVSGGKSIEMSGGFRKTTNKRMELYSVIAGLNSLKQDGAAVTIYSDSKYVVDSFTGGFAKQWKMNGWQRGRQPARNPDLWGQLLNLCDRHEVSFIWVKGHAEHKENMRCDELAVTARQAKDLPTDEGYEKQSVPAQLSLFDVL